MSGNGKRNILSATGLIVMVILALGSLPSGPDSPSVSHTPTPSATPPVSHQVVDWNDPAIQERARKGEQIYKGIEGKYHLPVQFTWHAEGIQLLIPTADWRRLSAEDKASLTYYAEKLTSDVRVNPKGYVDEYWRFMNFKGDSPAYNYKSYVDAASHLCATCWAIETGKPIRENGKYDFEPDDEVVSGATADSFRQSGDNKSVPASPTANDSKNVNQNQTTGRDALLDENVLYLTIQHYLRDHLNDPSSLQDLKILGASPIKKGGDYRVLAFYRAKNGFGALVAQRQVFILTKAPNGTGDTLFFNVRPE